jgi:protein-S-isoprenylcysteine O-methyltransferase Ste14
MYLAVAALIAGQGLLLGCLPLLIYALAFGVVTHLFVLADEEPTLRSTYAANVRRWLPRLTPWRSGAPSRPSPPETALTLPSPCEFLF